MARFRYVIADVFTGTPLTGNQLAVYTNASDIPEERMQDIAREMNFSETVFVLPPKGDGHVHIRIFTPSTELPFAGHPTLGSAFILAGPLQLTEIKLETGIGVVPVQVEREGRHRKAVPEAIPVLTPEAPCPAKVATVRVAGMVVEEVVEPAGSRRRSTRPRAPACR